jgi:hypothetical protein
MKRNPMNRPADKSIFMSDAEYSELWRQYGSKRRIEGLVNEMSNETGFTMDDIQHYMVVKDTRINKTFETDEKTGKPKVKMVAGHRLLIWLDPDREIEDNEGVA